MEEVTGEEEAKMSEELHNLGQILIKIQDDIHKAVELFVRLEAEIAKLEAESQ